MKLNEGPQKLIGSKSDRQIQWTVTVDPKGQTLASPSQALKVYDLLVYGKDNAGLSGSTGWPEDMNHNSFNQKYITGSFFQNAGTPSLTKVYTIKDSSNAPIADLLEVSVDKNEKNSYTFNSQVVNPAVFAGNEAKTAIFRLSVNADSLNFTDAAGSRNRKLNEKQTEIRVSYKPVYIFKPNGF